MFRDGVVFQMDLQMAFMATVDTRKHRFFPAIVGLVVPEGPRMRILFPTGALVFLQN